MSVGAKSELEQWRKFDRSGSPEDEPYYLTGLATFGQPPETARKAGKTGSLAFQYQGGIGAYRRVTGDVDAGGRDCRRPARRLAGRSSELRAVLALVGVPGGAGDPPSRHGVHRQGITFQYHRKTGFLELTCHQAAGSPIRKPSCSKTSNTARPASRSSTPAAASAAVCITSAAAAVYSGGSCSRMRCRPCAEISSSQAMPRLEAAGYPIVMHTHDECVCEMPDGQGSLEEFLAIVTQSPSWAPDLPIAAKARISDRLIEVPSRRRLTRSSPTTPSTTPSPSSRTKTRRRSRRSSPKSKLEHPMSELELPSTLPSSSPPVPPAEPRICAQCRLDPPDGSERASSLQRHLAARTLRAGFHPELG